VTRTLIGFHWDKSWAVTLEFKLADLWIGAFWKASIQETLAPQKRRYRRFDLWVCFLPCLPVHFTWIMDARQSALKGEAE